MEIKKGERSIDKDAREADGTPADEIIKEFQCHFYVLEGKMIQRDRKTFEKILNARAETVQRAEMLAFLSSCLEKYHGKKCIVPIDAYDVPLEKAWTSGRTAEGGGRLSCPV